MLFELICGVVIYQVVRRFFCDEIPGGRSKDTEVSFAIASRLEKVYGGKAYVGLRIPDPDTSSRQHIEIVLVTRREVMVVAVRSLSGFVDDGNDGMWICNKDGRRIESHPDPVLEITKQVTILEGYLEQRGVSLPKGHLIGRVVLPNPDCRISGLIESQPEVIPFDKWTALKSESKGGVSNWIKDAFRGGKSEMQEGLHQRLNSILSTAPMWDRLEFKSERHILGEFIEFKGNHDDMQALRSLKRSKVSQIVIQKSTVFGSFGQFGHIWEHQLEHWHASLKQPERVMLLKYEDLMADTASLVKTLANVMGCRFEEEEVGVVEDIVRLLCSFTNLINARANREGTGRARIHVLYAARDYRGEGSSASDWKEVAVKQSTEVVFHPMNSSKAKTYRLPSIVSLTLSA